jgi:hypothetical protein
MIVVDLAAMHERLLAWIGAAISARAAMLDRSAVLDAAWRELTMIQVLTEHKLRPQPGAEVTEESLVAAARHLDGVIRRCLACPIFTAHRAPREARA